MKDRLANPARTYAVVVGIDSYEYAPDWELVGPANDAYRFVEWLIRQRVPADQIFAFVSTDKKTEAAFERIGVTPVEASFERITGTLTNRLARISGDLLCFFWAGHGLIDMQSNRRLFCADATEAFPRHVSLTSLLTSWGSDKIGYFPMQIGFIDACANHSEHFQRAGVMPLNDLPYGDPVQVEQFFLLAASEGELAKNLSEEKAGAFSEALFEQLDKMESLPPDMDRLKEELNNRFTQLRVSGKAEQTPSYIWFRDWMGGREALGTLNLNRKNDPSGAYLFLNDEPGGVAKVQQQNRFNPEDQQQIVRLLEDVFHNSKRWETIISEIRKNLQLPGFDESSLLRHNLSNLLNGCLSKTFGYQQLLNQVHFYFEGTTAWLHLAQFSFRLLVQFPEEFQMLGDELVHQAESIEVRPEIIKRIYREVGAEVNKVPLSSCFDAIIQLFQLPDNWKSGIGFVFRLAEEEIGQENRAALKNWLEKAANAFSIQLEAVKRREVSPNTENHLLIMIKPVNKGASSFKLQCWYETAEAKNQLSSEPERLYQLAEIGEEIKWLATYVLNRYGDNFVVELIVEDGVFCHDITRWEVKVGQTSCSLVEEVPVVFRSLERFEARRNEIMSEARGVPEHQAILERLKAKYMEGNSAEADTVNLAGWREKWKSVRNFADQDVDKLFRYVEPIEQNIHNLWEELKQPTAGICVSFGFVPFSDAATRELFKKVIDRGTPIVLSFREIPGRNCIDGETLRNKILNQIPEAQGIVRLSELRSHIWKVFKHAAKGEQGDIGRYVMLLYDDYDRLPPPHPPNGLSENQR
jgi:hypothetical protein